MTGMAVQVSSISCCCGVASSSSIAAAAPQHCLHSVVVRASSCLATTHCTGGGGGVFEGPGFVGFVHSRRLRQSGTCMKKGGHQVSKLGLRAMAEETTAAPAEVFEVELEKPYGLRFYKGSDAGTYVDVVQAGSNADRTGLFTAGDKVLATSAVFGTEMWPAAEYGRTMYTIRQRMGPILMRMEKRNGKREDMANAEQVAKERNAGQIGDAVREIQIQNYLRKQELKQQREDQLNQGLKLYKAGEYQEALERFETVLGLKPEFRETAVASYNVACCYSKLNQLDPGLSAIEEAMEAGFDDYKVIREDPDLANLRASPKFVDVLNKYDEPFLNENAFNAMKSMFGFFGKK